jgi:hypothetical protein
MTLKHEGPSGAKAGLHPSAQAPHPTSTDPGGGAVGPSSSPPDLAALGLTEASFAGGERDPRGYTVAELLLFVVNPDIVSVMQTDPAAALLHHAAEWLNLLTLAIHEDPCVLNLESRLSDLRREIEVGAELHRRQRAALLEALAATRGAR